MVGFKIGILLLKTNGMALWRSELLKCFFLNVMIKKIVWKMVYFRLKLKGFLIV